jgi:hypothetical protein
MMNEPREKAVRKIADNYNSMLPEQQEKAAEMVQRIVKNDPDSKDKRLDEEQNTINRLQDLNISDNHREIILNDPDISDEQREKLQDISDEASLHPFSTQQLEQQALVNEIAPKLVDILNVLGTDQYEGEHRTIAFDKEENRLSLTDNTSGAALIIAEWHPDEENWEHHLSSLSKNDLDQIQNAWEQIEHHQQQQNKEVGLEH